MKDFGTKEKDSKNELKSTIMVHEPEGKVQKQEKELINEICNILSCKPKASRKQPNYAIIVIELGIFRIKKGS